MCIEKASPMNLTYFNFPHSRIVENEVYVTEQQTITQHINAPQKCCFMQSGNCFIFTLFRYNTYSKNIMIWIHSLLLRRDVVDENSTTFNINIISFKKCLFSLSLSLPKNVFYILFCAVVEIYLHLKSMPAVMFFHWEISK